MKVKPYFYFILIISIFTTLTKYEFAYSDHLSQLPLIMNEMDSDYLTNDFFVNANETFGPRFYYSKFMALGSRLMGIQVWFLFLSIVCAFVTAWYTFLTSFKIFKREENAVLAAIFVLILPTPTLAESTFFVCENIMTPSALVFPMLIIAFYHFFAHHRLGFPMILIGIASLFQILYGLTTGLLLLGTFFFYHLRGSNFKSFPFRELILSTSVLLFFVAASLIPYFSASVSSSMTTAEFVDIVAHFRNPHHYVPSYFPVQTWIFAILFFAAAYFAYLLQKREYFNYVTTSHNDTKEAAQFYVRSIIFSGLIVFGFVLGYVFVEIFPSRLVTTAQTFRYIILLKWIACIYFGFKLSPVFAFHPVSTFFQTLLKYIKSIALFGFTGQKVGKQKFINWYQKRRNANILMIIKILVLVLSLIFIPQREQLLLAVSFFVFVAYILFEIENEDETFLKKSYTIYFLIFATIGLAVSPFISQRYLPESVDNLLSKIYPKYDFKYKYDDDLNELSQKILAETDEKATFIVPPYLADIRFSANRAIVVDFKSIPYQDNALLEWRQRIRDCYGETDLQGFEAQEDLSEKFRSAKMSHLKTIQAKYKANYAIVESVNPIQENVIFENESYKLIEL